MARKTKSKRNPPYTSQPASSQADFRAEQQATQRAAMEAAQHYLAPLPKGNARAQMYLRVPFSEKESARNLGARWDAETRFWYVPHGYDIHPFRRWWPLDLAIGAQHVTRPPLHRHRSASQA